MEAPVDTLVSFVTATLDLRLQMLAVVTQIMQANKIAESKRRRRPRGHP